MTTNYKTKIKQKRIESPLPMRDGVSASRVWLPKDEKKEWNTTLDFLVSRFPYISRDILIDRLSRGDIVDQSGTPFSKNTLYQAEIFLFYYREILNEPVIPFKEEILFTNEHFIIVDKPHFIPVTPSGKYLKESLLVRLKRHYQIEEISPVHRLDRETAGIVMFTCNKNVRGAFQSLFQKREVDKTYHAIATYSKSLHFPLTHKSKVVKSDPFFLMKEEENINEKDINSETTISLEETKGHLAKYKLKPITGKQHQLRVHMMSLGHPILNDPFYPELLLPCKGVDYTKPLQLLAKSIFFIDPITGEDRYFQSKLKLNF